MRQAVALARAQYGRFWSYRRFVWVAPPAGQAGDTGCRPRPEGRPPQIRPPRIEEPHADTPARADRP